MITFKIDLIIYDFFNFLFYYNRILHLSKVVV